VPQRTVVPLISWPERSLSPRQIDARDDMEVLEAIKSVKTVSKYKPDRHTADAPLVMVACARLDGGLIPFESLRRVPSRCSP
jgi:hypothetical protein